MRNTPAGAVSRGVAERRDVNAVRPAMHRMGPAVARRLDELFRLDDLVEFWIARIRLGVDDVDARGAKARHDQIAPLDMRVWRVRAKAGAAGVPAEMVQLVAWRFQAEVATRRRQRSRPAPWPPSAVKGKRSDLVSIAPLGVSMGGNAIFAAGSDHGKTDERSAKSPLFEVLTSGRRQLRRAPVMGIPFPRKICVDAQVRQKAQSKWPRRRKS